MIVYQLPDGRMVVPAGVESSYHHGDGMCVVEEGSELYAKYAAWLERRGQEALPIEGWPIKQGQG